MDTARIAMWADDDHWYQPWAFIIGWLLMAIFRKYAFDTPNASLRKSQTLRRRLIGKGTTMISVNEIRDHLASYLAKEASFSEFEDWLINESWDMHKDSSPEAQQLVNEINASTCEYLDGYVGEDYLRQNLRRHLQRFSLAIFERDNK